MVIFMSTKQDEFEIIDARKSSKGTIEYDVRVHKNNPEYYSCVLKNLSKHEIEGFSKLGYKCRNSQMLIFEKTV